MTDYQKSYTKGIFIGLPCNAKCGFCNAENGLGFRFGFIYLMDENGIFKSYKIVEEELKNLSKSNYDMIVYDSTSFVDFTNFEYILKLGQQLGFKKQRYYFEVTPEREILFLSKMAMYGLSKLAFSNEIKYDDVKSVYGFDYQKFIPYEKVISKLENYRNDGVKCVVYEGGDFSIYPKIFEILEYGQKLGLEQTFQTNGIKLSDLEFVKKLKKYGINNINFSLHSYIEENSNKIMGLEKGFRKTIKAIKNCVSEGMTVSQNVVITNDNLNDLEGLILLSIKLKINLISFIMFIPPEDKINISDENFLLKYSPNPIEVGKQLSKGLIILKKIEEIVSSKILNIKFHNIPLCLLDKELYYSREYIYDIFRRKEANKYTLGTGFYKNNSCDKCKLNLNCTGITQHYIDRFGEQYIIPIVN